MDSLSKMVAIFIAATLLFLVPIQAISQRQDSIAQVVVDSETANFVDSIKYSGYISKEMYLAYIRKIEHTGNIYNVSICHSRRTVSPNYDEISDTIQDGYNVYFINFHEDEVLEYFDNDEDYKLNQGDFISVTVVSRNKTFGSKIMSALTLRDVDNKIISTYGGMIRDELD